MSETENESYIVDANHLLHCKENQSIQFIDLQVI